jgi:hypothetical protein
MPEPCEHFFRETYLTHFGGMVLLKRFCNRLGLHRLLHAGVAKALDLTLCCSESDSG